MREAFIIAFNKTVNHEGKNKWNNNPLDRGGETYTGIARKFHPTWPGWEIIDQLKAKSNFPHNLKWDELKDLVYDFYKDNFWNKVEGDDIASLSPAIADELFDMAVNMHWVTAAEYFQQAINVMNRNQALCNDLKPDGFIGPQSVNAFRTIHEIDGDDEILVWIGCQRGMHHMRQMKSDPTQETFARGWANRVKNGFKAALK